MKRVKGDFHNFRGDQSQMGSLTDNLLDLAIVKAGDAISSSDAQKQKAIDSITGVIKEGVINNKDYIFLGLVALAGFTSVISVMMSSLVLQNKK